MSNVRHTTQPLSHKFKFVFLPRVAFKLSAQTSFALFSFALRWIPSFGYLSQSIRAKRRPSSCRGGCQCPCHSATLPTLLSSETIPVSTYPDERSSDLLRFRSRARVATPCTPRSACMLAAHLAILLRSVSLNFTATLLSDIDIHVASYEHGASSLPRVVSVLRLIVGDEAYGLAGSRGSVGWHDTRRSLWRCGGLLQPRRRRQRRDDDDDDDDNDDATTTMTTTTT